MKGIDVSIFQGEVDWLSVRNAGIEFALIKCSQGGFTNSSAISPFTDRYFKRNIVGASDAGLLCGAYHLLMGVTVEDVAAEARYVVELLAPYKERITLPVAVDIEDARYRRNTRELNSTLALEFMRIVGEAGYQTMLYTNRDFLQNHYDDEMLGDIPIWFALYRNPRSDENVPAGLGQYHLLAVERRRQRQRHPRRGFAGRLLRRIRRKGAWRGQRGAHQSFRRILFQQGTAHSRLGQERL